MNRSKENKCFQIDSIDYLKLLEKQCLERVRRLATGLKWSNIVILNNLPYRDADESMDTRFGFSVQFWTR